jgi:hypothetical protein
MVIRWFSALLVDRRGKVTKLQSEHEIERFLREQGLSPWPAAEEMQRGG